MSEQITNTKIAVVGISCRFPDAETADDLFLNSIAQRRSFRKIPQNRLSDSYFDSMGAHPDKVYIDQAAVLKNFRFDRSRFKVSLDSYENTDLTHWLALTVAAEAIKDIRLNQGYAKINNEAVRVIVGNTLTGEFSRANTMRLRWPYVRNVIAQHISNSEGISLSGEALNTWLQGLEQLYKHPFPVPNEDFLSGGLANTIAGRICNHFNFKGGGYSVDGACSSSLLAVTDGCVALANDDADMVLAGGVDLSIDPFELVGFSRTMALAKEEMHVYDEHSQGFWPGEGCGFVALMRYEDAIQSCSRIYGVINGWGVSSDGQGGLTRPEINGQKLALQRCYERAGYGSNTVTYFEGHGTGTKVGDNVELSALIDQRLAENKQLHHAIISSVKANIGHTKAAAGLAGLIRALKCLEHRVLPPTTGCAKPHKLFSKHAGNLSSSHIPNEWAPKGVPRRAGVSSFGFGGINTHITLEEVSEGSQENELALNEYWPLLQKLQDTEVFLFSYSSPHDLLWTVNYVAEFVTSCSRAEFSDLSAELAKRATNGSLSLWRASVVASTPKELSQKLQLMSQFLDSFKGGLYIDKKNEFAVFGGEGTAKIGYLFSGQGAPVNSDGGLIAERLKEVKSVFDTSFLAGFRSKDDTDYAQPAITLANVAGLQALKSLGVQATLGIGHSLGELSALYWSGVIGHEDLMQLVLERGRAMAGQNAETSGSMLAVNLDDKSLLKILNAYSDLHIANFNSASQNVVSGKSLPISDLADYLKSESIGAIRLPVKQAFHSPYMKKAADQFKKVIEITKFLPAKKKIISTLQGHVIDEHTDWVNYLYSQITAPVYFQKAVQVGATEVDLFIELGPGEILANLAEKISGKPALALNMGSASLRPLLMIAGTAFVAGQANHVNRLYEDRFFRRFKWGVEPKFLSNQCELNDIENFEQEAAPLPQGHQNEELLSELEDGACVLETLREITAQAIGLPKWSIQNDSRMLTDLHLNSIAVSKIVNDVVRSLGVSPLIDPTQFSNSSISEIAQMLDQLNDMQAAGVSGRQNYIHGALSWVRYFEIDYKPAPPKEQNIEVRGGEWKIFSSQETLNKVRSLVTSMPGHGTILYLDRDSLNTYPDLLLNASQEYLSSSEAGDYSSFVVVQTEKFAGGFLKSLSLENPNSTVILFTVPAHEDIQLSSLIRKRLITRRKGYSEFKIDKAGEVAVPFLKHVPQKSSPPDYPVNENDLVLISGGAKGISAECGYQLALKTGCALLIIGRSNIVEDDEVARNIERLQKAGLRATYFRVDVTDRIGLTNAIQNAFDNWGVVSIAGVIHGAGVNNPKTVKNLETTDIEYTLSAKIKGFKNLVECVDLKKLKLLVCFGSIIGRIGMHGEADYALANERLSYELDIIKEKYPHILCRNLEWSIWSGTGMGQNLGSVDTLLEQGIAPITIEDGIREFLHLISNKSYPTSLIVTSRFVRPDSNSELYPCSSYTESDQHRYIEKILINYPGIELVADCKIDLKTDLYLKDHELDGASVFPAALTLEVLTQAANTIFVPSQKKQRLSIENIEFTKALVVPETEDGLTLRVCVVVENNQELTCVIRSSENDFQIDHVRAQCKWINEGESELFSEEKSYLICRTLPDFNVEQALYQNLLFQKERFQRVSSYQYIQASRCVALLPGKEKHKWFSDQFEEGFLLGDPGIRDSILHGIQVCMPHKVLIPVSVKAIQLGVLNSNQSYRLLASEITETHEEVIFNILVLDEKDTVVETWDTVVFRKLGLFKEINFEAPILLAPFMERYIKVPLSDLELVIEMTPEQEESDSLGNDSFLYRPDGKPESYQNGEYISKAHTQGWQLKVSSNHPIGCDLQWLSNNDSTIWSQVLDANRFALAKVISEQFEEAVELSALRVWTILEAVKKMGLPIHSPITLDETSEKYCVKCKAANFQIYSSLAQTREGHSMALTIATEFSG
ncbi:MAG: SDR family NAD(P)-dependent oxidoreductase [Methylocystaceae bacterium]|nr:SDR family NAD(P)-dependent oxidoreductase [Methylocystaceae bacterium]